MLILSLVPPENPPLRDKMIIGKHGQIFLAVWSSIVMLSIILAMGAYTIRRENRITELINACGQNDYVNAERLLREGVSANSDVDGTTPLKTAVITNNASIVELLLAYGADPNRVTSWDEPRTALEAGTTEEMKTLLRKGIRQK